MATALVLNPELDMRPAARDRRRWFAMGVIVVAQLLIVLDATVVTIALPTAQQALHISQANRQWALTAYTLAFGGLLLLGGRIADYTGRKRAFIIGLIGFAAASALGGAAVNQAMLFGSRALQGAFAALMAPAALSLLTVTFHPSQGAGAGVRHLRRDRRWRQRGRTAARRRPDRVRVVALDAADQHADRDRGGAGRGRLGAREPRPGRTRYDVLGAITSTLGLVALVYGFTKAAPAGNGESAQWGSPVAVTMFVLAAVLLVSFVLIELRSKNPLLPMRVLRDRNRGGSFLIAGLIGVALFGTFLFLSYYLQQTLHYTALRSGVAFLPFTVGVVAGAILSTQVLPRFGARIPMTVGLALAAAGMVLLTRLGADDRLLVARAPGRAGDQRRHGLSSSGR